MFNPLTLIQFKKASLPDRILSWCSQHMFEIMLITFGTCMLFSPPNDYDFGWHFKYGEYFWQHFSFLKNNTFSYTFTDYKFVNSYALAEIVMYFLYHNLGLILGSIIPGALLSFTLVKFAKKTETNKTSMVVWFILITSALNLFQVSVRPLLYSTVFLYFLLYTLIFNKNLQKYLPILFLIWANTHADFVLGLFIYGIYTIEQIGKREFEALKNLIISTLVTLININGIWLWTTMISELVSPFNAHVSEWVSPFLLSGFSRVNFLGFGLIFAVTGLLTMRPKNNWYKIVMIIFFLFSLKAVYMLRILYILGSVGLIYYIEPLTEMMNKHLHYWLRNIFIMGVVYTILFTTILKFITVYQEPTWTKQAKLPYEAVRFLEQKNLSGNILNNYDWGGYLIWKLPKYKTFIDGRMTSWKYEDRYFMDDYYKITKATGTNNSLFYNYIQKYNIRYVLDRTDSKFVDYLSTQSYPQWILIYTDDTSVILEKKD